MCGIAGFSGEFSVELLNRASTAICHRGPDGSGLWYDSEREIGLGHRRLSIIDLSPTGAQPMKSDDASVVLAFNGEIYNFRELRRELEAKGHSFRGSSDTEVLLRLYLEQGTSMLARLNGVFAFALWDSRSSTLFLARDALGVKPLYFSESTCGFAFASELKALLLLTPAARELDLASIHRYMSFLWCPGEGTPLKTVKKLSPGEALLVQLGQIVKQWSWYRLPSNDVANKGSPAKFEEGVASSLRRAVQRQLVADVPVGAFLSGGLDSSAIVAFAKESVPDIRCFTIEPTGELEQGVTPDLPYARRAARHLGVKLDIVHIDSSKMAADFAFMIAQLDEPIADPAPLNVYYISKLAKECGIKVLLSGAGGDDLFTGYRRHAAIRYERYWQWLPAGFRFALERMSLRLDQRRPASRRLAKLLHGAGVRGEGRLTNYFAWLRQDELLQLYTGEVRETLRQVVAASPMLDYLGRFPDSLPPLEKMLLLEQRFFLADHNLMYTDKMSMAAGVEVRVPFLDLDLVEYAAGIPLHFKQNGKVGKWILKRAMEPYLPRDLIYRPKTGFGAPLRSWMRQELRPLLGDMLSAARLKKRGLFDPSAVQALIARNDNGQADASYTLLALLGIEIWCRTYLDVSSAVSPHA